MKNRKVLLYKFGTQPHFCIAYVIGCKNLHFMKNLWLFTALSLLLAVASFCLAWKGIEGWGWFLFGAIITFVYPSSKSDKDDDE